MSKRNPAQSEYVKNAIRNNPLTPNRTLAKLLHKEKPDYFTSVDHARSVIRYHKGKVGDVNRAKLEDYSLVNIEVKHGAKVLLFDLETAPLKVYTFSKWPNSISDDMIIQDWFILTWSAKWLFNDGMYSEALTAKEALAGDDERIVKKLWKLFEEADVLIAHNLNKFDRKKANTRFIKHGLTPPSPYQSIDTLLHARKQFAITSNRLDYIASNFLNIQGKQETPRGLWFDAMQGSEKALQTMREYCDQDVRVLEDVYLFLRPYIQPHPNIGLFNEHDTDCCTHCGHDELESVGEYHTYVNIYDAYRCKSCGAISRGRQTTTPIKSKRNLKVSVPK